MRNEALVVIGPRRRHPVRGQFAGVLHCYLLQRRLGVVTRPRSRLLEQWLEEWDQRLRYRLEPALQIDRPDDRFEHVGQKRRLIPSSGALLALAEKDVVSQTQFPSEV